MRSAPRARLASLSLATAVLAAALALAALALTSLARAGSPVPGGTVPSTLALSLGEPGAFRPAGAGGGGSAFTAVIRAEVTITDVPARLSVADGEATAGPRLGHLVRGSSVLSPALEARADDAPFRSLDAVVPPQLQQWSEPVARAATKVWLRQVAPSAGVLRSHHKLLLITLAVAGP